MRQEILPLVQPGDLGGVVRRPEDDVGKQKQLERNGVGKAQGQQHQAEVNGIGAAHDPDTAAGGALLPQIVRGA
jgi:hypothetical protein